MQRVSSRQRLVSWDAFDATVPALESDWDQGVLSDASSDSPVAEEYLETLTTAPVKLSSASDPFTRKRKKTTVKKIEWHPENNNVMSSPRLMTPAAHLVPAFPSELPSNPVFNTSRSRSRSCSPRREQPKPIALFTALLPQDAQLQVFSFLGEDDTRTMMEVNHHFRHLLQNSPHVWNGLARQRWPFLAEDVRWTDNLHLPQTVPCPGLDEEINMNLLLHLAADTKSSCIDQTIFTPCPKTRSATERRVQQQRGTLRRSGQTTELRTVVLRDGEQTAVQFTGIVGFGDRCIRADQPLPHPHALTSKQLRSLSKLRNAKKNIFQRLLRRKDAESPVWRPFVAPFCLPGGSLSFTPRLISYFEVHIVNTAEMSPDTPQVSHPHGLQLHRVRGMSAECVAVGLSTAKFDLHKRMPGWDAHSYGFHGDDGGIFHNSGQMVDHYGPSFGVGDVVGCGIDYKASSIFYTVNGKFLGYAFELSTDELSKDWFPTVGVDTNSLVQCNFGTDRPFCYDLQAMIEKDKAVLCQTAIGK